MTNNLTLTLANVLEGKVTEKSLKMFYGVVFWQKGFQQLFHHYLTFIFKTCLATISSRKTLKVVLGQSFQCLSPAHITFVTTEGQR